MANELRDVFGTIPQGWHHDGKDMEAVEQVLAKPAGFYAAHQVTIGRRHDSAIHLDGRSSSDGPYFAVLDRPQDLDLRRRRKFADIIEEQRPARRF